MAKIRSDGRIWFTLFSTYSMETEEIAILGLDNMLFGFVAESCAHFRKVAACLEGVRKGLYFGLGDGRMP
jgi:hypothetical protein